MSYHCFARPLQKVKSQTQSPRWFNERAQHVYPIHALTLLFQSFQGELLEVEAGEEVEQFIECVE